MKPSSSLCLPISPKSKNKLIWRSGLLLSWILTAATFIFLLISSSSPNPLSDQTPKQNLHEATSALPIKHHEDEMPCDLFVGRWIWNPNGSLYTNRTCKMMPESKNCGKHGKEDKVMVNWRWKPNGCNLPRFHAQAFLEIVRGKKLAFIGDSVARNQMDSLLCLLSQVETPVDLFKTAEEHKSVDWHFPTNNFTLMTLWTKFLVEGTPRLINGSDIGVFNIQVDKIDGNWTEKLPEVDYAIISSGHWFFRKSYLYEGDSLKGCVFCDEANVKNLGLNYALRRAFRTALKHINRCRKCEGLITLLRTFSPAHFEYGTWNDGGRCNRTMPMAESKLKLGGTEWEFRSIQVEEVERAKVEGVRRGKRFGLLDVTRAMMLRPDGHPDTHWNNNWNAGYSDCVHWCLPGPIDTWNDLLLEVLRNDAYTDYGSVVS